MIEILDSGHYRSVLTDKEKAIILEDQLQSLSPDELAAFEMLLTDVASKPITNPKPTPLDGSSMPHTFLVNDVSAHLWDEVPVPIEEWVNNPYYIGDSGTSLFKKNKQDVIDFFNGSFHEYILTGGTGVGKCQAAGSFVQSGRGLLKIEEFFEDEDLPVLHAESGPRKSIAKYKEGLKPSIRIETHSGSWCEGTPQHRYRVLTPDFEIVWKRSDEIVVGDYLVRKPGAKDLWGSRTEVDGLALAEGLARLVGLWVAEGWYAEDTRQVRFCSGEDRDELEKILADSGASYDYRGFDKGAHYYVIEGPVANLIRAHFDTGSASKNVPRFIREAGPSVIQAFLSGYYGGDGGVVKNGRSGNVEVTSKSFELIDGVKNILWCLGIKSRRKVKTVNGNPYHRLIITDKWSKITFKDQVGFCFRRKSELLSGICDGTVHPSDNDHAFIPFAKKAWGESYKRRPKELKTKKHPDYEKWSVVFNARKHKDRQVTRRAVRTAMSDPRLYGCVSPLLRKIVEEGLEFDLVESVCQSEAVMYDFSMGEDPSYVCNGFVSHNTYVSTLCIMRILYELNCFKSPQATIGLAKGSPLYVTAISRTKDLARRVAFGQIAAKLNLSRYFIGKFRETKEELWFPDKNVFVIGTSSDHSILGMDVVAGMVDEGNFMGSGRSLTRSDDGSYDKAETIYNGLVNRIQSRLGRYGLRGFVFLASSKRGSDDFTERRIKAVKETMEKIPDRSDKEAFDRWKAAAGVFVRDYSTWGVKPEQFEGNKWWKLAYNPSTGRSRILELEDPVRSDEKVAKFPGYFYDDFVRDPIGSLRDKAGLSVGVSNPFFTNAALVDEAFKPERPSIFRHTEWCTDDVLELDIDINMMANARGDNMPRCCPGANRCVSLDLSLKRDATGFVMGHDAGMTVVKRKDPITGRFVEESVPVIHIDGALRIIPPAVGEIDHESIRELIYRLRDLGYPIRWVTMDQWSRGPNAQLLRKHGLEIVELSVDSSPEPYTILQSVIYERRLECHPHAVLQKEIKTLESTGKKIDHRADSSKDVSDALAACVTNLVKNAKGHRVYIPEKGLSFSAPSGRAMLDPPANEELFLDYDEDGYGDDDFGSLPGYIA